MNPALLVFLLGGGAVAVYLSTRPPVQPGLTPNPGTAVPPGGSTPIPQPVRSTTTSPTTGALSGGWIGIVAAGAIAIGSWIWNVARNEAKGIIQDFAKQAGFIDLGVHTDMTQAGRYLYPTLVQLGYLDLVDEALNRIGKHDTDRARDWCARALQVLQSAILNGQNRS